MDALNYYEDDEPSEADLITLEKELSKSADVLDDSDLPNIIPTNTTDEIKQALANLDRRKKEIFDKYGYRS